MSFLKMLLSFIPWISFLVIAQDSLLRLKLGIIVAAVLTVIMAIARLNRGVIMWVGMLFFAYAILSVVILNDMWTVRYMGVFANGALAVGVFGGLVFRRPFTLEYARDHTDPSLWDSPIFLRTNYILTSLWAVVFTISAGIAWQRGIQPAMPDWGYDVVTYGLLIAAMFVSSWYPQYLKQQREKAIAI